MYKQKTRSHTGDVESFLAQLDDPVKQRDSAALVTMMQEISGEPPVLWGSMVGFGRYHYRYESGHEGDALLIGFAPRKPAFSIYLMGDGDTTKRDALLARLGRHRMGKGCLYVKRLSDIDMTVLREMAGVSIEALRARYPGAK
ncbi:protein of unknown function (DU1801) [Devosia sp. YR412]|uniref:DUF1801 domain-containing protein n=1 Tax=Devosia sp. YR412 TaxID=1881030 RepID=UPI0008D2114A|nr:DUF1801 domain-containing protein [Devosia sp. YR412]SEQ46975.1 protein of unknown function (DU1801) [Devosia sp. YR412]